MPAPKRTPSPSPGRITVPLFSAMKTEGRKISMLTAYDFPTARMLDEAGVDGILVGDSLGMVVQGHDNTLPVTLQQILYHAEMVGRAVRRALVVVDLPFLSYQISTAQAIKNAGRILKETRCQAVKLEGNAEQAQIVAGLVRSGIPVMGHVGLRPQNVQQLGGYKVQRDRDLLLEDALAVAGAGAFAIVLECVPASIAAEITRAVAVPTIGIGAGAACDGQVLVTSDMLGLTSGYVPRFAKQYVDLRSLAERAVASYCEEVRGGAFPSEKHTFK